MTDHLSEQDLDEILLGAGSTSAESHVAACDACRAKVQDFHSAVALFNQASLNWAEAKSNTLTRELTPRRGGWLAIPASSVSLAAALLVALGLAWSASIHHLPDPGSAPARAVVRDVSHNAAIADTAGEIANDNAILRDIDSALYKPEPSPAELYRDANLDATAESRGDSGQAQD